MSADGFWGAGGHDQPDRPDRPETPHAGADTPSVARRVPNADRHEPPTDERHADQPPPNRRPAKWVEPRTDEPEARTHTDEPGTDEPAAGRGVPDADRHERRTDEPRTDEPRTDELQAKDATPEVGSSQEGTLQSGQAQVALPHSARPHSDITGSGTDHGQRGDRLEDFSPDRPEPSLEHIYQRLDEIKAEFKKDGYTDADNYLTSQAWESDDARLLAQERFDLLMEAVKRSDFSVPEDKTPVFYSGQTADGISNHILASRYANENNGALVEEDTQGGNSLNQERVYDDDDPIRLLEPDGIDGRGERAKARELWVEASGRYADAVAQPGRHIVAFVDPINLGGIYSQVERPRLVARGVQLDERSSE